jgi:hypothetical protein
MLPYISIVLNPEDVSMFTEIDLRAAGEITAEEFTHRKGILVQEKARAEELLNDAHGRVDSWLDDVDEYLAFAERAVSEFNNGTLAKKKEILYALGSNLTLLDKIFSVHLPDSLKRLETVAPVAREVNDRFEPQNTSVDAGVLGELYSQNPVLLSALNEFTKLYRDNDPEFMDMLQQVTLVVNEFKEAEGKMAV